MRIIRLLSLEHDVFICHASEDKNAIARPLAEKLVSIGVRVWYDEFSLKWGDKLMSSITKGLKSSKFGIVIFSPSFFGKKWTQMELDALIELSSPGENKILPLLHDLTHEQLAEQQPMLTGIVSRSTTMGVDALASEIKNLVDGRGLSSSSTVVTEPLVAISDKELFEREAGNF